MIKASVVSLGLRVFQTAALFLSGVLWARNLGVEAYGVYAYIWSIVTVLSIFTLVGTPNFISREVAAAESQLEARKVVLWSFNRVGVSTVVVATFLYLMMTLGFFSGDNLPDGLLWLLVLALVLNTFLRFYESVMRGLHKYLRAQLFSSLVGPLLLVMGGGYYYVFGGGDERDLIGFRMFALLLGCIFLYPLYRLNYRIHEYERSREWGKSLRHFVVAGVAISANYELAVILVANLLGFENAGVFNVVTRIASVMSIGIVAISTPVGPRIATHFKSGDFRGVQDLVGKTAFLAAVFTAPMFLGVFFCGEYILSIYGEGFVKADAIMALRVLAVGQFVATIIGPSGVVLVMTKNERFASLSVLFSVFIMVLLSFLLVPKSGIVGGAVAVSSALVIWKGLMSYWGWKKLGVVTFLGSQFLLKRYGV